MPGELGIQWDEVAAGRASGWFTATKGHMAPNGFLHAGCVITLADSMCGSGTMENLPSGARGYTTLELKANLLATTRDGRRSQSDRETMCSKPVSDFMRAKAGHLVSYASTRHASRPRWCFSHYSRGSSRNTLT